MQRHALSTETAAEDGSDPAFSQAVVAVANPFLTQVLQMLLIRRESNQYGEECSSGASESTHELRKHVFACACAELTAKARIKRIRVFILNRNLIKR